MLLGVNRPVMLIERADCVQHSNTQETLCCESSSLTISGQMLNPTSTTPCAADPSYKLRGLRGLETRQKSVRPPRKPSFGLDGYAGLGIEIHLPHFVQPQA